MFILYWLKFIFIYLLTKIRPYLSSTSTSGFGKKKIFTVAEKEQVRNLKLDGFSIDASYFNAFDYDGRFLGMGMQKRPDGRCESIFFIRVPEIAQEPLVSSLNPSAWVNHVMEEWKTDKGLKFEMREPMTRWKVSFEGDVVELYSRKPHKLVFNFEWNKKSTIFDADVDMDSIVMADAIASEKWSRKFFDDLQEFHQTHYELFGELSGQVVVDNNDPLDWNLTSMKDRSYGKHRFWGDFRRYILHYIGTENELYIGCHFVSITKTFRHLIVGFVMDKHGNKEIIRTSTQTLFEIGEDKLPFDKPYSFQLKDTKGKTYDVKIGIVEKVKFFCGPDREGTLYSAFVKGTVNGYKASGLCEYEYNSELFSKLLDD